MSLDTLGNFQFVGWHRADDPAGAPELPREMTEIIQRPGVDGTGLLLLGSKGQPFQMRSAVDLQDGAQAVAVIDGYRQMIGAGAFRLIWGSIDFYAVYTVGYLVLDVTTLRMTTLSAKAGGITPGATVWLESLWTLLPVTLEGDN